MNILIYGKSGCGKTEFADLLKNIIFKTDSNAKVELKDLDSEIKSLGDGTNVHRITVSREVPLDLSQYSIVANIRDDSFKIWFGKI
jgi:energy-coupling factor transporter ATP-binding protein EcfA2